MEQIAAGYGISKSKVKIVLFRLRQQLKKEFDDLLHSKLCLSPTVEMNASFDTEICRDDDNNVIMTYRIVQQKRNIQSIHTLQLEEYEAEKSPVLIGTFQVPRKVQDLKRIELDVSQSVLVKKVLISGMAIQLTFDDDYANEQFEQQLKDSGEWYKSDFDLEAHGYSFYNKKLVLVMKDGTKHVIWNRDVNDDGFVANSLGTGNDGTGLVDEIFGFTEFIDVDEIAKLFFDPCWIIFISSSSFIW